MAKKKCPECRKGTPLWMVSWADMVTLLMCFFVIIVAFSTTEAAKFKEMAGSMKSAFGVVKEFSISPLINGPNIVGMQFQQEVQLINLRDRVRMVMNRQIDNGDAEVEEVETGFIVRVNSTTMYDEQSGRLLPGALELLEKMSELLAAQPNIIHVKGFWNNKPVREESPWKSSADMAVAVTELLVRKGGIDPKRLVAMAMGPSDPIQLETDSPNRVGERRIEILFTRMTPSLNEELPP